MDIDLAISTMEAAITSGRILKSRIEVDNHSVSFQTLDEQLRFYEYLKQLKAQSDTTSPYARGRLPIGDAGDGLR
jgi:hypothetical protein